MIMSGAVAGFVAAIAAALVGVIIIVAASEATVPLRRRILASMREGRE